MSRQKPYWKNKNFWVCPKHLPSVRIPRTVSICYFSNCSSVRPKLDVTKNPNNNVIKTIGETTNIKTKAAEIKTTVNNAKETPISVDKVVKVVKMEDKNQNVNYCTLDGCENVIPENSNRRIYCSDRCRKKFARAQYRLRMKAKQERASK